MDNGNGAEGCSDLSIDNRTFDHNINAQHSSSGSAQPSSTNIGTRLLTAEGHTETSDSYGDESTRFVRFQRRPTDVDGASICNILPVPALDFYKDTPPPSEKVGEFVKHPEMYSLRERLATFLKHHWPLGNPSASTLGNAGFFYTGPFVENGKLINDQVTCFKCGRLFREWEEDDDPLAEHRSIYPQCFEKNWIIGLDN